METSEAIFFSPGGALEAWGPDAHSFLQGQFSNNLQPLSVGGSAQGLWLNRKGKIVAESAVLRVGEDRFLIVSPFAERGVVEARLNDFLVMDEVELAPALDGWGGLCICGPETEAAARRCELAVPDDGRISVGEGVIVYWGRRGSLRTLECLMEDRRLSDCRQRLSVGANEDWIRVRESIRFESLAVEFLAPRVGIDVGENDLPQEVGLVDGWVSFNKGCYLGQEVMARLHSMGRLRKRLVRVELASPYGESYPCPVFDDEGRKRGELRLAAEVGGRWMGLAVVPVGFSGKLRLEGSERFSVVVGGDAPGASED